MPSSAFAAVVSTTIRYLDQHPWLSGVLGWALGTLLWEGFVKRGNARRGLAHMLAEEVALNLTIAAQQRAYSLRNSGGIPDDLHFSNVAFEALTARLSELPKRYVGEIITYYEHIWHLNRKAQAYAVTLAEFLAIQRNLSAYSTLELGAARRAVERQLAVYKTMLDAVIEQSNLLLPKLRASSTLGGRLGYVFVPKKQLMSEDVDRLVGENENKIARAGAERA